MKKALKIVGNVILWLFVAFAAITMVFSLSAAANNDGVPSIFGKSLITIQSDSMNPTFKKGDLIFDDTLSGVEKMTLEIDDVITFKADLDGDGKDELNTHRIIDIVDAGGNSVKDDEDYYKNNNVYYRTQGDNKETNATPDEHLVRHDTVVGKYTGAKLGGMGKVLDFLQSSTGFLVVIVLPLALFFIYELYNVISAKRKSSAGRWRNISVNRRAKTTQSRKAAVSTIDFAALKSKSKVSRFYRGLLLFYFFYDFSLVFRFL